MHVWSPAHSPFRSSSQPARPTAPQVLQGTTNAASILPAATWQYAGDAAQHSTIQLLQRDGQTQVTASVPGGYTLSSGTRRLTRNPSFLRRTTSNNENP